MQKDTTVIDGHECRLYGSGAEPILIIQPSDSHDLRKMNMEVDLIRESSKVDFRFCALKITNWEQELTPWKAEGLFRQGNFGDGARSTLQFINNRLLPEIAGNAKSVILGGYSLAGLFSLWCAYQLPVFDAIAAMSPSVWYKGWADFMVNHNPVVKNIYLSMGDQEEKTRNKTLSQAGNILRNFDVVLNKQGVCHYLEWNEGNHFANTSIRNAKGFVWALNNIKHKI